MSLISHQQAPLMSIADMGKQSTIWQDFPANAIDTLQRIEQLYLSMKSSNRLWTPESLTEMVNQLVFNIYDSRDLKSSRLSTVQKLCLAEILFTYLSSPRSDSDRQVLFNTIFYRPNFYNGEMPLHELSLLTSLAMSFQNPEVLNCVGMYMMSAGLDSPTVMYLASDAIKDFISDEHPEKYEALPKTSLIFSASLLIAVGKIFRSSPPPGKIVKQVTLWVELYPSVCFIPPHSAIFEIFRWCINSKEDMSTLHFGLLSAIERAGKGAQLQVIPHVMTLIQELRVKREQTVHNNSHMNTSKSSNGSFSQVDQPLDRLFQLIQMLISSECLDRNEIHPIFEAAEDARLPSTPFYEIMRGMYLK